ncbi:MAG: hypothetical protein GY806_17085 [Gammaproteobacteria bacterium]|nr:hypothetical protein [Gammaproteobacteria bacterium]
MAAYLVATEKLTAEEAMKDVLSVRPIAFSAQGWMEFCLEVLIEFENICNNSTPRNKQRRDKPGVFE